MTEGPSDEERSGEDGARDVAADGERDPDRSQGNEDRAPAGDAATSQVSAEQSETGVTEAGENRPEESRGDENADAPGSDGASAEEGPTEATATDEDGADGGNPTDEQTTPAADVPADVRKYDRFKKIDGGTYDRANEFLRDRTYITAREWAIARLCADFRTETGVEMTKIGENLPQLVPFMTDTYTPQAVNQARSSFEDKVRKSGATFLYGAMCDFFTAQELDDVMYEATEVAKFLLEVEGVELSVDDELEAEDRISEVMREVREHSAALRHDEMTCPECGHEMNVEDQ